jgi:hypothetical protein
VERELPVGLAYGEQQNKQPDSCEDQRGEYRWAADYGRSQDAGEENGGCNGRQGNRVANEPARQVQGSRSRRPTRSLT